MEVGYDTAESCLVSIRLLLASPMVLVGASATADPLFLRTPLVPVLSSDSNSLLRARLGYSWLLATTL